MHIQKLLPVICVAALVGSSALNVLADDNDVQAKAREALRQKMSQMDTQSPTNAPPAAKAPAAKKAPAHKAAVKPAAPVAAKAAPAPKHVEAPAAEAPVAQVHTLSPEEFQKLLTAERSESDRLAAQQDAADKQKAEAEELAAKRHQENAPVTIVKTSPSPEVRKVSASKASSAKVSPAVSSKEAQLQKLLQDYRADLITPAEYHEQRAKILGE